MSSNKSLNADGHTPTPGEVERNHSGHSIDVKAEHSEESSRHTGQTPQNHEPDAFISTEDTSSIFEKITMPSLMLTNLKVKKSKQAIQDSFSVLNSNMNVIDHNMKDLLFLVKDLAQVLFICFDSRLNGMSLM